MSGARCLRVLCHFRCEQGYTGDQCDEDVPFVITTVEYILIALYIALLVFLIMLCYIVYNR